MAMTIKVNGAVFEFDEVSEYLEFAEATGLGGLAEEDSSGTQLKEPPGKDANGEDLYEGDYVTGSEGNDYAYTNDKVVMEVLGAGKSPIFNGANVSVRIVETPTRYNVDSSKFVKLSDNLDEAKAKFDELKGEGEDELLPVGTKVRLLSPSNCGDLRTGDVGTITYTDIKCSMGLVYSVRVRSGEGGYGWVGIDGVEVVKEDSPTEFRNDDLVRVTESFRDSFGDVAKINSILPVRIDGDGRVLGVGTVLIGDNHDKLQLVCRREDRKDIEL